MLIGWYICIFIYLFLHPGKRDLNRIIKTFERSEKKEKKVNQVSLYDIPYFLSICREKEKDGDTFHPRREK